MRCVDTGDDGREGVRCVDTGDEGRDGVWTQEIIRVKG